MNRTKYRPQTFSSEYEILCKKAGKASYERIKLEKLNDEDETESKNEIIQEEDEEKEQKNTAEVEEAIKG